jgi:hypothetical protein
VSAAGVLEHLHRLAADFLLVDGEVAVVHFIRRRVQVDLAEQALIVGMPRPALVLFLEDHRVLALHRVAFGVVLAVLVDGVDEEQAQHLDAQGPQAFFLVQMFLDRAPDHFALDRRRIHIAPGVTGAQEDLAARHFQFHELIALGGADFTDADIGVQGAAGFLLQIETVLNVNGIATHHAGAVLPIHFNAPPRSRRACC